MMKNCAKHVCTLLLCMLISTTVIRSQGIATWLETVHDFGTFPESEKTVTGIMKMVNTGDSAMIITHVQTTCGCTVAEFSHDAILPGDTALLKVSYDNRGIPGQFEKKIFVYTNGMPRKSVLAITGNVIGSPQTVENKYPVPVGAVRLNTANLPLGEMYKGKTRNAYISGYNTSTDTMLVNVAGCAGNISTHVLPDTVSPGGLFIVSVYYESAWAKQWGLNVDTLNVTARPLHESSSSLMGAAHLYVMAQVKEDFSKLTEKQRKNAPIVEVLTDKIDFETVAAGSSTTRMLTVKNLGKDKLIIRRLFVPDNEGIVANCEKKELKRGQTTSIAVTLNGGNMPGKIVNTQLTIITNDPYTPQTLVRMVGQVGKAQKDCNE